MSDSKSIIKLREEYPHLDLYIHNLEQQLKDYAQFSVRTNPPTKTYKQLEEQLALAENSKQTAIDDLLETKVIPLNQQIVDLKQQLNTSYDVNQSQKNRIKDLEIVRDNLNRMIDFAVGYISATQPHTDKHPMEVKQWLFKGLE